MNTMECWAKGEAARRLGATEKVFDWEKAAKLIKSFNPKEARAGLSRDWEWTGGPIFRDGKPVPASDTYTFLASVWATPELDLDGDIIDCWRPIEDMPGWDAHTYWPPEALAIIGATL